MIRTKTTKQTELNSPRRRNLLLVIGSFEIGGAEKQMFTLVRAIQDYGISCHVFSLQRGGPLSSHFSELGVPVHSGGLEKGDIVHKPWKLLLAELRLLRLLRRIKPLVLHSFLPLITFMGAVAGRACRVPLVITSRRALGNHQDRYVILKVLDKIANALSHYVVVNSKAVWNDVIARDHVATEKLVLIYNGVDGQSFESTPSMREELRREMGVADSQRVVTVVANLIPYKGHLDLFQAARQIRGRVPGAVFWLVGGDRGIQRDLENAARDLEIHEVVTFMGQRSDIPDVLAASDLSVLPSHEEGFSNVILESMAAGLPVVATGVGGNSEAVVDGVTGWLVPPRNPALMTEKIVDLLGEPQKARSWGERGRERVKRLFTVEQMVDKHLTLYEKLPFVRN
jgi:glycosyltransferase involved in cell wall biosynthesis